MKPAQVTMIVIVMALVIAVIVLYNSLFVVNEMQYAVVTQFGQPKVVIKEPGLKARTPFVQKVRYLPRLALRWRGQGKELVTKDKTYIWADTWALWRIVDPLRFYQTLRTEANGHGLLDDQIESASKEIIAGLDLIELVRSSNRKLEYTSVELRKAVGRAASIAVGRRAMCRRILEAASSVVAQGPDGARKKGSLQSVYGIELLDVQINHVIYVAKDLRSVYDRMRAERKRIADKFRSEGVEKANQIRGEMAKELKTIESSGYRKAQELRGQGDAEALTIYAKAYSKDPEFYQFWKTLKTYEKTIDSGTTLIMSPENEYFKTLANPTLKPTTK